MALLDEYERKARLTPGPLSILPVAFSVATLGPKQYPAVSVAAGLLTTAGGTYLLAVVVAQFGRLAQEGLWKEWGGRPTTQLLRLQSSAINATQRDIWRSALEAATGVRLSSLRQEAANPQAADDTIEAATDQMRYLSHDSRFRTLATENAQYGFERNMYGFRWIGRAVAALSCAALIVVVIIGAQATSITALVVGIVVNALILIGWLFTPSKGRTRGAAFRYGSQLLQATVIVARDGRPRT
jgi:hypothetical protein